MWRWLTNSAAILIALAVGVDLWAQSPVDFGQYVLTFPKNGQLAVSRPTPPMIYPIGEPAPGTPAPIAPHVRAELSPDALALVAGNNHFAVDIYRSLSADAAADKNVLVSPFSISAALAMTYAGARGETARQMAGTLGFTLPDDRVHPAFGELLKDLTTPRDGYQLSIANRLFGQAGYPFEKPFLDTTGQSYGAPLEAVPFRTDADGSRQRVNSWVEDQTNDKIKDLMPKGSVTPDTRLVLANAVYFKGSWKNKFDVNATYDDTFFGAGGRESQVPMMHQQRSLLFAEQPSYKMLEMPYAGDDLSMVVILPKERDGLSSVEKSLSGDALQAGLDALRNTTVDVALPKFKFESEFKLVDSLKGLGITDAFDADRANFSGIVDPTVDSLYINAALHKAFIEVNEEGTEAAAATAIGIAITTSAWIPPQPEDFIADHPFLFALRDLHSGSLLFLGRVVAPGGGGVSPTLTASSPEPPASTLVIIPAVAICGIRRRAVLQFAPT